MTNFNGDELCGCGSGKPRKGCCPRRGEGADADNPVRKVVSLCDRRARRQLDGVCTRFVERLASLHELNVSVHNDVITHCKVSVLSELIKVLEVYYDLMADEIRTSVLTPFSLYGRSCELVFGKEALQKRAEQAVRDPEQRALLRALHATPFQVWHVHDARGTCNLPAHPFVGPDSAQWASLAGVVTRAGEVTREPGVYTGWPLRFEGYDFLAFGYRLGRGATAVLEEQAARYASCGEAEFWELFELALVRLACDPLGRRSIGPRDERGRAARKEFGRKDPGRTASGHAYAGRAKTGREQAAERLRECIEREFVDAKTSLTLRVHLVALAGDERGAQDFMSVVEQICQESAQTEARPGRKQPPVTACEVLALYHLQDDGMLPGTRALEHHPLAVLLVDDALERAVGGEEGVPLDRLAPIGQALRWCAETPDHPLAPRLEESWESYRHEQCWLATYGLCPTDPDDDLPASIHEPYRLGQCLLGDMRALFDPQFFDQPLDLLPMPERDLARLREALASSPWWREPATLDCLPPTEAMLTSLAGLGDRTIFALREALLILGRSWRWTRAGLERRSHDADTTSADVCASFPAGFDELARLLE